MKPAGQMTLTLTPELEQFVRSEAKRGAFASNSEYVRNLVRERYEQENERTNKLQALNAALSRGLDDVKVGRILELDEAFSKLRNELQLVETTKQ
jgi:antitoxin ParD1/3/4